MMRLSDVTDFKLLNEYLRRFYMPREISYTLDRMKLLMSFLDNPQDKLRVVHVAGTSGKTSTAYYVSAFLALAGQKTGLSVSPYIDVISERVQVNNQLLPEKQFCSELVKFIGIVEESSIKPSWFELIVAFTYYYFNKERVDYAVIEVGLGGLLDGTNVINRADKVCLITDIGLDHTKILGNSLKEITLQKAGIIQASNAVIINKQPDEVMTVIEEVVKQKQAELIVTSEHYGSDNILPGYQERNWSLAYEAYKYVADRDHLLDLSEEQLLQTKQTRIPGRMEVIHYKDKVIIMDGAHNLQKMTALVNSLSKLYPGEKAAVLVAMKEDKDFETIAPLVSQIANRVVTTNFNANQDIPLKSMSSSELAEVFSKYVDTVSVENQKEAFKKLVSGTEKLCLITGSLYMLGQIRQNEGLV